MDTFAETHVISSAVTLGAVANAAGDGKRRFRFEPVTLKTDGIFGKTTEVLLKEIGIRISEVKGNCRKTYWIEPRIGFAVQRGNALSILAAVRYKHGVGWS